MFKKLHLYIVFGLIGVFSSAFAAGEYKNQMLPGNSQGVTTNKLESTGGEAGLDSLGSWLVQSIDSLLPIAAVGVFLFVGIRLAVARGNPEEFKKAFMQFVYAVVGITIITLAWAAVKLISGLSF